jgi:hypothetical protein
MDKKAEYEISAGKLTVDNSYSLLTKNASEIMLMFYSRLYPFKSIFQWLNHEHTPTRLFTHREFAFTLANDVYLRYNSFVTADELKKQVCFLNPSRFEIGPVYSARVCFLPPLPSSSRSQLIVQILSFSQRTRKH